MSYIMTQEHKRKLSIANKDQIPWSKGKHFTEEHREKLGKAHFGLKHTQETKIKISQSRLKLIKLHSIIFPKGKKSHAWRGGEKKHSQGYVYIFHPNHPSCKNKKSTNVYVFEHRLVMEKHLGRYLKPEEVVHHINDIKSDNRLENLKLFSNPAEHHKFHHARDLSLDK
jgi:hypothetical protein